MRIGEEYSPKQGMRMDNILDGGARCGKVPHSIPAPMTSLGINYAFCQNGQYIMEWNIGIRRS
jgi:hypothetical protein